MMNDVGTDIDTDGAGNGDDGDDGDDDEVLNK